MQIPVLIENVPGNGFRASGGEALALIGEGSTPEAALAQLQENLSVKLKSGARLASIEITPGESPWLKMAGMYDPADPLVQEWLDIVREGREQDEVSE